MILFYFLLLGSPSQAQIDDCYNFNSKNVTFSFASCIRSNFQTIETQIGIKLDDCYNPNDKVSFHFANCIRNNYSQIAQKTNSSLETCYNNGNDVTFTFAECVRSNFSSVKQTLSNLERKAQASKAAQIAAVPALQQEIHPEIKLKTKTHNCQVSIANKKTKTIQLDVYNSIAAVEALSAVVTSLGWGEQIKALECTSEDKEGKSNLASLHDYSCEMQYINKGDNRKLKIKAQSAKTASQLLRQLIPRSVFKSSFGYPSVKCQNLSSSENATTKSSPENLDLYDCQFKHGQITNTVQISAKNPEQAASVASAHASLVDNLEHDIKILSCKMTGPHFKRPNDDHESEEAVL